ncbi:hypothetical protein PENTCL1PPCAC_14834, partial [Pristionchus entomophagus]
RITHTLYSIHYGLSAILTLSRSRHLSSLGVVHHVVLRGGHDRLQGGNGASVLGRSALGHAHVNHTLDEGLCEAGGGDLESLGESRSVRLAVRLHRLGLVEHLLVEGLELVLEGSADVGHGLVHGGAGFLESSLEGGEHAHGADVLVCGDKADDLLHKTRHDVLDGHLLEYVLTDHRDSLVEVVSEVAGDQVLELFLECSLLRGDSADEKENSQEFHAE